MLESRRECFEPRRPAKSSPVISNISHRRDDGHHRRPDPSTASHATRTGSFACGGRGGIGRGRHRGASSKSLGGQAGANKGRVGTVGAEVQLTTRQPPGDFGSHFLNCCPGRLSRPAFDLRAGGAIASPQVQIDVLNNRFLDTEHSPHSLAFRTPFSCPISFCTFNCQKHRRTAACPH